MFLYFFNKKNTINTKYICKKNSRYKQLISEYIDGELSKDVSDNLLKHLNSCNACNNYYEKLIKNSSLFYTSFNFKTDNIFFNSEGVYNKIVNNLDKKNINYNHMLLFKYGIISVLSVFFFIATLKIFPILNYNPKSDDFYYSMTNDKSIDDEIISTFYY
jgi:hypothetical protein